MLHTDSRRQPKVYEEIKQIRVLRGKSRDIDRNDVSRLHMVPQIVSGSETSFRMSYEIVPV